METLTRFVANRHMLMMLDNCEHLLDASATLAVALLGAAEKLTLLATSREPIGVAGEVGWRMPSMSLAAEAIELFTERARHARPGFTSTDDNAATVAEICRRLDGLPLAIELAAARVRALSLTEILDSLHDRFRLLTGGSRTAVRRQQTLRASVDWSHALLTEPERVLFRRLAVFMGGFDLDAAQAVGGSGAVERYQVLDQLSLLVDKSLVVADDSRDRTQYRLLETVRQYAQEKLGESGEADAIRSQHRDHYTSMAAEVDAPAGTDYEQHLERAQIAFDNIRAAFNWSCENSDTEAALALASSLQPLWFARGRVGEGLAWFDTILTREVAQDAAIAAPVRARALADKAVLASIVSPSDSVGLAQQALAIARNIDDPAVLARALTACGFAAAYNAELAGEYFAEAIELARASDDKWRLTQILAWQAHAAILAGDPVGARVAGEEGRDIADAIGDGFDSRHCRTTIGLVQLYESDLDGALANFRAVAAEAVAAHDGILATGNLAHQASTLAWQGDTDAARTAADASLESGLEFGSVIAGLCYIASVHVAMASGDTGLALHAATVAWEYGSAVPVYGAHQLPFIAQAALASGDLVAARRWADDAVAAATTWLVLTYALTARARVAIAVGELERAECDAHDALACVPENYPHLGLSDSLECLATVAGGKGSHREAVRIFGAVAAIRRRIGTVRFKVWEAGYESWVATLREAMGEAEFETAWAEGAALSSEEAIAYARRGRGERKRPTTGWDSLTPAERDVVRLVSEGLANNDIATRLFVSPRTVQSHLTHVYTKLSLTSRVQLAQEVARHA
jgi:predicted ATPase/DNA-binding CsgD family transcriptional regulator